MKKQYRFPDAAWEKMRNINRTVMYLSGGIPMGRSPQDQANDIWREVAKELGFVWDSVEPAGGDEKDFLATPILETAQ